MNHFFDTVLEASLGNDLDEYSAIDAAAAVAAATAGVQSAAGSIVVPPCTRFTTVSPTDSATVRVVSTAAPPSTPTGQASASSPNAGVRPATGGVILGRGWGNKRRSAGGGTDVGGTRILRRPGSGMLKNLVDAVPTPGRERRRAAAARRVVAVTGEEDDAEESSSAGEHDEVDDDGDDEDDEMERLVAGDVEVCEADGTRTMLVSEGIRIGNADIVGADLLVVKGGMEGTMDVKILDVEEG